MQLQELKAREEAMKEHVRDTGMRSAAMRSQLKCMEARLQAAEAVQRMLQQENVALKEMQEVRAGSHNVPGYMCQLVNEAS